jgi:hypothetical protein
LDDPYLDGKTHSLEVGNRPAVYILEAEEEAYHRPDHSILSLNIAGKNLYS